jgi:hypothetical protein
MLATVTIGVSALAVAAMGGWYWMTHSVEQPAYAVAATEGVYEIRDYPAMIVAEAATRGERWEGVRQGFRALAGYIVAKNRDGDTIAMTAPVIQESAATSSQWRVRFVMPSEYALEDLPTPAAGVTLERWPAARLAAIRFGGVAEDGDFERHEERLRGWIAARGLEPEGGPLYAYHDDPWTPGFLRRNEVLLRVQ